MGEVTRSGTGGRRGRHEGVMGRPLGACGRLAAPGTRTEATLSDLQGSEGVVLNPGDARRCPKGWVPRNAA